MVRYMPWADMGPHLTRFYTGLTRLDTVPTLYADARTRAKSAPIAVTAEEGGEWISWDETSRCNRPCTVHSIKFADGSIWDAVNGWRQNI